MTPALDHAELVEALEELAAVMQRRGERGRIYVAGGAAMILAHAADRLTRDVDAAIQEGYRAVTDSARVVAERRGWPRTWLNEGAVSFMPGRSQRRGTVILDRPALKVVAATSEHMLAMKVKAARAVDEADAELLLREGRYSTLEQVEDLVSAVFPDEPLHERQRRWVAALLERTAQQG